jgi:hypothetical protein
MSGMELNGEELLNITGKIYQSNSEFNDQLVYNMSWCDCLDDDCVTFLDVCEVFNYYGEWYDYDRN